MSFDPHPLQVSAQSVIKTLYAEHNLPVTPALISYTNREYARLEDIIDALDLYSGQDVVQKFYIEHATEIESARALIAKKKEEALKRLEEKTAQENPEDDVPFSSQTSSLFASFFDVTDPGVLRKFSVEQIESSLSSALEQLTGEKLEITLNDLQFKRGLSGSVNSVDFSVHVSGWSKSSDLRK